MKLFKLLALMLLATSALAQTPVQGLSPISMGVLSGDWNPGSTVYNIDAAGDRVCYGFQISNTKTLSKVKVRLNSVVGSPGTADIEMDLRADSSGLPSGSSLQEVDIASGPTGSAWNEWTGFSTSLTAGTRYHLCVNNSHGTPASNYVTIRENDSSSAGPMMNVWMMGGQSKWGWNYCFSSDTGATCSTNHMPRAGIRLEFSDGTFAGTAIDQQMGVEGTNKVYAARELGVTFTTPADGPTLNIRCVAFHVKTSGTVPAGGARYRLYSGTGSSRTLEATTETYPNTNISSGWAPLCFISPLPVLPGTAVSLMLGVVSGGDASNYLTLEKGTIDNTAASKALQFMGDAHATYLNSTFADEDTAVYPFIFSLDTNEPFNVDPGSSGGLMNYNTVSGGAQ